VIVEADIYAVDGHGKEISGTRKGRGKVTQYFSANEVGKFSVWTQEFDAEHINMCRARLDSLATPEGVAVAESQWFVTHHTFLKEGGRQEFMKKFLSTTKATKEAKARDLGFYRCALMPCSVAQEGVNGPIFCVWETKAGTTKLEMHALLESDCFPISTLMKSCIHPIDVNPGAPPYPVSKLKGERAPFIPNAIDMNSKFFMLHHLHKESGANQKMVEKFAALTPEEMKDLLDAAYVAGFAPHSSMHSPTDGMETFCVWETTMEIKRHEMEELFEGPLFRPCNGLSINIAYEIDISEVGVPYPPKLTLCSPKSPKRGGS
jgi:hypothetical protein